MVENSPDKLLAEARKIVVGVYSQKYALLKKLDQFESSIISDADKLWMEVCSKDSRSLCIITVSFLENCFKSNFIDKWKIKDSRQDEFFGSNGPLSSFSQKVLVAEGIGWLEESLSRELNILRKIRNEFSHNHRIQHFTDEPIQSYCSNLSKRDTIWNKPSMQFYIDAYSKANKETILRMRFFSASLFIIGRSISRSKLLSNDIPPNFMVGSEWSDMLEIEQFLLDAVIKNCFQSLSIEDYGSDRTA